MLDKLIQDGLDVNIKIEDRSLIMLLVVLVTAIIVWGIIYKMVHK